MLDTDLDLGPHTTALIGVDGGRYPAGNTVLVRGERATAIIDPSTSLRLRADLADLAPVDMVVLTHAHEDHLAGVHLFPGASVHIHEHDVQGARSLDGLMEMYGMSPDAERSFREIIVRDFSYVPRPDAIGFADGEVIDLGGVTITPVHLPGHTRGHTGMLIEPDGVFVTGDIDLSAFGPYYGDEWSSLDDFEVSLARARGIDARWYVTFHHKGVIDGRDAYLGAIDAFTAVIAHREDAMVAYADEPRSLEDFVAHRFVYRPHVTLPFVDTVELRSARMSIERLAARGRLAEVQPGRWQAASA
jgi:glyoxylase-like metal-dependent hydrolase (beta-lactamase superfamily II)